MKRLFLLALAFLIIENIQAQKLIQGHITDQQSGAPLVNANVQLMSLTDSAMLSRITDASGYFRFTIPVRDSFLFSFSFVGYSPVSRKIMVDSADVILDIAAVSGS